MSEQTPRGGTKLGLPTPGDVVAPIAMQRRTFSFTGWRLAVLISGLIAVVSLHWGQFLALFGLGSETPRFDVTSKADPLPVAYVATLLAAILVFELIPYLEELARGLRANRGRLVPPVAKAVADRGV